MTARLTTLLIWAAVLAGAVAWGLPLFTQPTPVPAGAGLATPTAPQGASLARLLGQAPAAPLANAPMVVADSRFKLLGVVAPRSGSSGGLALISVDGKPARAFGVGRELEPGLRLLTVGHRQVALGAGQGLPGITLQLPALADAQRGRPGEAPGALAADMPQGMPGMGGTPGMGGQLRIPQPGMPQPGRPGSVPQGMAEQPAVQLPYQPDNGGQVDQNGQPVADPGQVNPQAGQIRR